MSPTIPNAAERSNAAERPAVAELPELAARPPRSVGQSSASQPRPSSPLELATPQCVLMIGLVGLCVLSISTGRSNRRDLANSIVSSPSPAGVAPIRIRLNSAAECELNLLPGIGDKMAAELVAARERLGEFRTWDDIASIPGMGPATIAAIRPWCEIAPTRTKPRSASLAMANH